MAGRMGSKQYRINKERGLSLTGLIVALMVIGMIALVVIKAAPAWIEFRAINNAVTRVKSMGGSIAEMKQNFDKNAETGYIDSLSGRDLIFTRDNGDVQISFSYEKRIPLAGNASLVFDFSGTTDPTGVVAEKTDTAAK
jgi:type II secretory pathway pseudopilin PulG